MTSRYYGSDRMCEAYLSTCNFCVFPAFSHIVDDREDAMPNDRRRHGARDRTRINMSEDSEVEYWAEALGVSKERLIEATKKVGDSVQAVRTELSNGR